MSATFLSRLAGNQVLFTSFNQIWNKCYDDSRKKEGKKKKEKETHTILDSTASPLERDHSCSVISKEVYFIFLEIK